MNPLVVIPTYNERSTLPGVVSRLLVSAPEVHVLIVDDNSADGTGAIADELAAAEPRLQVLHRPAKQGLGTAYRAGMRWGLERGHDVLVEMDADGSHAPEQLPRLLSRLDSSDDSADLVIGARYIPGGGVHNWSRRRWLLSRGANTYVRWWLRLPLHDSTAGFRAYRREVLKRIDLDTVTSQGYCFQVEMAWRAFRAGFRVVEVPIDFTEREQGSSKMGREIVLEALRQITIWGIRARIPDRRE
ncbi:MAG: polyprenol monophosphomannose synthase [Actinomycetales bacterium]